MSPASDDERLRAVEQKVATLEERTADDDYDDIEKRLRALESWKEGVIVGAKTATMFARGGWTVFGSALGVVALFIWQALTGSKPL